MRTDLTSAGVRIVLADDAVLLREGLAQPAGAVGHTVAAAVGDAEALLAAAAEHRPDVVIIDVRMPPTHTDEGLRAARSTARRRPGSRRCWCCRSTSRSAYAAELLRRRRRRASATC